MLEMNRGMGGLEEIMQLLEDGTEALEKRREKRRWNNILQEHRQREINILKENR